MAWQDANTSTSSNAAAKEHLTEGAAGELLWNRSEFQLEANSRHQISVAIPLTGSGAGGITTERLMATFISHCGRGSESHILRCQRGDPAA